MEIKINPTDYLHQITDAKISLSSSKYKLKWTYTKADGFFVVGFSYDVENFDYAGYISNVLTQCDNVKVAKHKADNTFLLSFIRANVTNNGVEVCDKNDFQTPMIVKVFPYEIIDGVVVIYNQDDEDNTSETQYIIKYTKSQPTGLKALFKSNETIRVSGFDSFFTGLLYYTVLNVNVKYPINENMINREFEVNVPKGCSVDIKVDEKYRKFFKCISN